MDKRKNVRLWLEVSKDKFELPMHVCDSIDELARVTGAPKETIVSLEWRHRHGRIAHSKYITVVVDNRKAERNFMDKDERYEDEIEWRRRFSTRLKKALDDNDMIPADLADEIGISETGIYKYINKSTSPSFYNVMLMSEVLNVRLEEFI